MALMDFKLGDIGDLFRGLREAITGEGIQDPETKLKLLEAIQDAEARMLENQAKVIVAEAQSESYLVANWRPITMLSFVTIVVNNYIFAPYLQLFGVPYVILDIPPDMWGLLQIGIGGYIASRGAEKTMRIYKGE